jgi:hypothetical protein
MPKQSLSKLKALSSLRAFPNFIPPWGNISTIDGITHSRTKQCLILNRNQSNLHRRVYGVLIQIDIKGEKLWIQYDGTEVGVANELVEEGINKDDIVLAYHSPFIRQYDGFAVG